jgi:hypothetical protein
MKEKLDLIESRLQALIEGSITLLLPWGNPQQTLAHQLVESMQMNLVTNSDGYVTAPSVYQIQVHPSRSHYWQSNHVFLDRMAKVLYQSAMDAGFHFQDPPTLNLVVDPSISPAEIRISTLLNKVKLDETASLPLSSLPNDSPDAIPANAFLIVNGVQNYPLKQPVINIGRRLDNHLVIDDPRVSRSHAQLRAIKGHYVLFDLNSTGGTFVNNERIAQCNLNPGDVISLAGVALIYGQDVPPATASLDNPSSTQPSNPGQPQQPDLKTKRMSR